ncbi:tRNA dimethylallyltransferase [Arboricoccus pini]|uniref:tRNA dimethylallyltransferase n=1 Tax=Arboricoccus pini TaxID=1963835 RepID=A0A212QYR4_9PROT|nr:tRNA (adenosine(37)-N6)-dimethylallyltransferase MiaA [Arboricoccus pini]SNB64859.1 tRNA dimethylallyltransferase [Arboricoccus pini]
MAPRALVVIGGTTASGKSALAMEVARAIDGIIVNVDSQQLFADLPILTARPTAADEAMVPHRLYGVLEATSQPSAGRWLDLVAPFLAARDERPLVLCGGTGLYLKALFEGIVAMPAIPAARRAELARETAAATTLELHARLAAIDPVMAARLRQSDRQRILRALEVVLETGRSLAEWQAGPIARQPLPSCIVGLALVPPGERLAQRIMTRLEAMIEAGALDEVSRLQARLGDFDRLPIAKVHGARELLAVVRGQARLPSVLEPIAAQIRQYAKRQRTFLRHQLTGIQPLAAIADDPSVGTVIEAMIREVLASRP